jgi:type III pantothenate kinase
MILDIDIGNSLVKWRLINNQKPVASGSQSTSSIVSGELLVLQGVTSVSEVRASCVANTTVITALQYQLFEQFSVRIKMAQVTVKVGAVTCGYKNPQQLGVDRWLAIVAAYKKFPERLLVVDAGSAITVDLVNGEGLHLGGYIFPGLRLMNESLRRGTAAVDVVANSATELLLPGEDTQQAVNKGCLLAAVAAVEKLVLQHPSKIVVTGGDAQPLIKGLCLQGSASKLSHCPDLVLDGLSVDDIGLVDLCV